jgi:hypothetical protein
MWAVVIVPAYLKRHDRRELERSFRAPLTQQLREQAAARVRPPLTARQRAFVRRRRVLMGLLTSLVAVGLAVLTGAIPVWSLVAPVAAIAMFMVAAARYATSRTPANAHVVATAYRTTSAPPQSAPTATRSWRPLEVPLPSYLSANRAPRHSMTAEQMLENAAARKAEIEQMIRDTQARSQQMRDLVEERAKRAAMEQRQQRAVGE